MTRGKTSRLTALKATNNDLLGKTFGCSVCRIEFREAPESSGV